MALMRENVLFETERKLKKKRKRKTRKYHCLWRNFLQRRKQRKKHLARYEHFSEILSITSLSVYFRRQAKVYTLLFCLGQSGHGLVHAYSVGTYNQNLSFFFTENKILFGINFIKICEFSKKSLYILKSKLWCVCNIIKKNWRQILEM